MGYSRFGLKVADVESKSIPHEIPSSHWLKATGQCVLERYLSATMRLAALPTVLTDRPKSNSLRIFSLKSS